MPRQWGKEPWRRLYVNESIDDQAQPLLARGLRDYLLRKARQDNGVLVRNVATEDIAITSVVRVSGAHEFEFETCVTYMKLWITDGYLVFKKARGGRLVLKIANFVEAQTARSQGAIRQSRLEQRKREAAEKIIANAQLALPQQDNPSVSPNVSPDVRPDVSHASDLSSQRQKELLNKKERKKQRTDISVQALLWVKDPQAAGLTLTPSNEWQPVLEVLAHCDTVWDHPPAIPRIHSDHRVQTIVERLSETYTVAELKAAIDGSKKDPWIQDNIKFQDVTTLLKDGAAIDKYTRMINYRPNGAGGRNVQPTEASGHYDHTGFEEEADRGAPAEYLSPSDPLDDG